jgi:DNA-binding XRE family transcriptional regulator
MPFAACSELLKVIRIYSMGRPSKNRNHPIVRLRKALSTPNQEMTREMLAKKVGVPVTSLRDLELERYKLTPEVALKISFATGVDYESLLRGDDPLLDLAGDPLSSKSKTWLNDAWGSKDRRTYEVLLGCLLKAAEKKKGLAVKVGLSFSQWIQEASLAFGLDQSVFEEFFALPDGVYDQEINTGIIPDCFFPRWMAEERRRKAMDERARRDKILKDFKRSSETRSRSTKKPSA